MLNKLAVGEYVLITCLISSNMFTSYYIYPLLPGMAGDINQKSLFCGAVIGLYEVFRIVASLFWKKIGHCLGSSFSLNLSLFLLIISNFLICIYDDLSSIIVIRIVVGLCNGLSSFTKNFILENFNYKSHKRILSFSNVIQNFCIVFALLLSLIPFSENFSLSFVKTNKYFFITLSVCLLNFLTLLLCLLKFKKRMIVPKRRTLFREQVDLDVSRRKESPDNNSNVLNNIRFDSNMASPGNNLDNFSSNLNKIDLSEYNSKDSAVETEEHQSKTAERKEEEGKNQSKIYYKIEEENKGKDGDDEQNNSIYKDNKQNVGNIIKPLENIDSNGNSLNKSEIKVQKESSVRNTMIKILNEQNQSFSITTRQSELSYYSILKISSVFALLQMYDAILYVKLLFEVFGLNSGITYEVMILTITLKLCLFHLLYAVFSPLINSLIFKNFFNDIHSLNSTFKIFLFLSAGLTVGFFLFENLLRSSLSNDYFPYFPIVFIAVRNLGITACLTSYNLLIHNIKEPALKNKIQSFMYFLSFLLRGVLIIVSFYVYSIKNDNYKIFGLCAIPTLLICCSILLVKTLNKIISAE